MNEKGHNCAAIHARRQYKCIFEVIGYGEIRAAANSILNRSFSFCRPILVSLPVLVIYTIKQIIKVHGNYFYLRLDGRHLEFR